MAEIDNIPEMRPSFDNIRRHDESENEYWSSRDLCAAMGYSAYWKFQKVIDKAIKVAGIKGVNIDEHFNQAVDMVKIGSGSFRKVRLSGNFWLVSFKISYLCLPLFYETRTTPSCHPSGCAYRQL